VGLIDVADALDRPDLLTVRVGALYDRLVRAGWPDFAAKAMAARTGAGALTDTLPAAARDGATGELRSRVELALSWLILREPRLATVAMAGALDVLAEIAGAAEWRVA
jgi:hypothetical protein